MVFLLPAGGNQPEPSAWSDAFIYTGGQVTRIDATGCHPNTSAPVQNAVLVELGFQGRSGRIVGVVTVYQTGGSNDPVDPATKLTNLVLEGECTAGGTAYKRYRGIVD